MSAPIWFAFPPETHSSLLSAGPGPGSLLAAAGQMQTLAEQYVDAQAQLSEQLGLVRSGLWEGEAADRFVAAYQPFLAWLGEAAATAVAASARYEDVAAGYAAALAAMPTLGELAANHAAHALLESTNFLGINTVPIALNEADYVRMWIQAGETMTAYQSVVEQNLATMPSTPPAPSVLAAEGGGAGESPEGGSTDPVKWLNKQLQEFVKKIGDLADSILPAPLANVVGQIVNSMSSFLGGQVFNIVSHAVLDPVIYGAPFAPLLSPAALLGAPGAAGLAGLAGVLPQGEAPAASEEGAGEDAAPKRPAAPLPAAGVAAAPAPTAQAPASSPASAASPASVATPAHVAQPAHAPIQGGPSGGEGFPPVAAASAWAQARGSSGASSAARRSAGAPNDAILAQDKDGRTASSRRRARQYRMRFLEDDEWMSLSERAEPEPVVTAGEQGAGQIGASGAAAPVSASGMVRLDRGSFGDAPTAAMLPQTWNG
ncbi:PPE family protein [Segniliparus rugosus]|uniref:PPE family protein n=1 Tax=Segniliparus rugosus (strain ATCC BAA-974 / DSM 45345 / CCUG 50838 / CIP 108380 / JCM 13579 / CDC 945) TaxID=679197 RepID=U1LMK5_SEGRC|nr:PPE family protein [Segniliparus rugosus]ERG69181.1 hypothetical protein HMPREF9336_04325 [Segniliparus rugosus ATCC BAA-974]